MHTPIDFKDKEYMSSLYQRIIDYSQSPWIVDLTPEDKNIALLPGRVGISRDLKENPLASLITSVITAKQLNEPKVSIDCTRTPTILFIVSTSSEIKVLSAIFNIVTGLEIESCKTEKEVNDAFAVANFTFDKPNSINIIIKYAGNPLYPAIDLGDQLKGLSDNDNIELIAVAVDDYSGTIGELAKAAMNHNVPIITIPKKTQ